MTGNSPNAAPFLQNVLKVHAVANRLLNEYGLAAAGWTFEISNTKTFVGRCSYDRKQIEVSKYFLDHSFEELEDTIRHEIAHALAGSKAGHNHLWRLTAIRVGAKPERCAPPHVTTAAKHNYVIKCPNCGWNVKRHRMRRRNFGSLCPNCDTEVEIFKYG